MQRANNQPETSPQSAELFHLIVENIRGYAVFMTDADGRVVSWNPGVEALLGYAEDEFVGQPVAVIFTPEDLAAGADVLEMETARATGCAEDKRRHVRKDGSRFWANGMLMPLKNDDDTVRGYAKVMRDDTEQKLAEDKLEQILSSITDSFYRFDRDFRYTYVNRAATEMFGIAEEDFLGRTLRELFPETDGNDFHKNVARALQKQEAIVFENYYEPLDRWFENRVYPSADGLSVFTSEITTRKRAEGSLRESEDKYRTLFDSIDEGFSVIEVMFGADGKANDYRFLEINPSFEKLTGISADIALGGKSVREFIPNLEERWFEIYGRVAQTGEAVRFVEGSKAMNRWFDVYAFRVGGAESRRIAILFSNVTERRQSEEKVRESEERYRGIVNQTVAGIAEVDLSGKFLTVNERLCAIVGYTREELLERRMQDITHADDLPGNVEQFKRLANGGAAFDIEKRYVRKDGSLVQVQNYVSVIRDASGEPQSIVAVINDITTRKQTEENLKHQKTLLEALTESVLDGIIIVSPEGKILHVNRVFLDIWNFPAEIVESKSDERALDWAANQTLNPAEFLARVNSVYEKPDAEVREEVQMKDGRVYERFGAPILSGEVKLGWVWTFRDITTRKRAELNLAFLAEISRDLTQLESVDDLSRVTAGKIGEYFGVANCVFAEVDITANTAAIKDIWRREDAVALSGNYRLSEFVSERFLQTLMAGESVVVNDVAEDSRTVENSANFQPFKIVSFVNTPFISNGVLTFFLGLYRQESYEWRADEIELLGELMARIWTRIERARAEEALRESEDRFRNMADNAPVMIWVTDASGYCNYLSQSWYDFTGQTPETGLGLGWVDAVHPDERAYAETSFITSNEKHQPFSVEYRFRRTDGEYRWAIDSAQPRFGETGEYLGYIGSVVDIHERKQTENALRESEEQLRALADSIPQLTWMAEPDGFIFWYNRRWYEYTGTTPEEMAGWGWQSVHDAEMLPNVLARWQASIQTGEPFDMEFPLRRGADKMFRWFLTRVVPVRDLNGRLVRWFGTNTDIEELRQARLEAEQANKIKDEFLATLSHELRTPLNAILGWAQMLQSDSIGEGERKKALATIERNARAQNQLIDDLLDVSRIITGKLRLDVQAVDLLGVITETVDAARPAAEAKNIRLQALLDPQAGPISGDPNRLQQIVWNLLSNAVKFTPKGGRVQVRLERVNSHVEIVISDTGKGIDAEFVPFVFDRFRQSDGSMTRRHGGLGLGLAIVRQLVELHGGTVAVSSAGDLQGATFTVNLPLLPVRTAAAAGDEPRVHPAAPSGAPLDCPSELTDLRILLVDDEADSRDLLNLVLDGCGAQVTTAASAAEAFEIIEARRFDVIISDIGMPGEDGFSLIGRIRRLPDEAGGNTPAIALTAYARAEDRVQALRSGFQMHVAKPVEPSELIAVAANLAGRMRNPAQPENAPHRNLER